MRGLFRLFIRVYYLVRGVFEEVRVGYNGVGFGCGCYLGIFELVVLFYGGGRERRYLYFLGELFIRGAE